MIGISHHFTPSATFEGWSIGPLWPGLVIRGVWVSCALAGAGVADFCFALCNGPVYDFASLGAGESLIEGEALTVPVTPFPAIRLRWAVAENRSHVLPVYVPIREGSKWFGIGAYTGAAGSVSVGLYVEPEGQVFPAYERGPAARTIGAAGGVLDTLRAAATGARV